MLYLSHPHSKKINALIIVLILIGVVALAYWLWLASWFSHRLAKNPNWQEKIISAPKLPSEASIVLSYTGEIRSLNLKNGELTLLTAYGEKKVMFTGDTPIRLLSVQPLPDRAPSASQPAKSLDTLSAETDSSHLNTGDLIQVSSLTNVQGLATFRANTIVVLK